MINKHAVGVIFENPDGQILVLKRHSDTIEGSTWGLVGGHIDEGEDVLIAAVREVEEELGLKIDSLQLIPLKTYVWERDGYDLKFETMKFLVNENFSINLDKNENVKYEWTKPQELINRDDLMEGLYPILEDEYMLIK